MITNENLKEVLHDLNSEDIKEALDLEFDYVIVSLSIFNAGSISHIIATPYDSYVEEEVQDEGNLFLDIDDFLRLLKEQDEHLDIVNEYE